MKLEKPCIPWFFPRNDTSGLRICDPWEAMKFKNIMDETPVKVYKHCLTDCSGIIYHASVTAAPFSRCDFKNIGVSDLCNFDVKYGPAMWGQSVMDQYKEEVDIQKKKKPSGDEKEDVNEDGEKKKEIVIPEYITEGITSNLRKYTGNYFIYVTQSVNINSPFWLLFFAITLNL